MYSMTPEANPRLIARHIGFARLARRGKKTTAAGVFERNHDD
jgi:hypothetical protein